MCRVAWACLEFKGGEKERELGFERKMGIGEGIKVLEFEKIKKMGEEEELKRL